MAENEMVGWHHQLGGREFEQAPGDDKAQGSLGCCRPRHHKEPDTTAAEQQEQKGPIYGYWLLCWVHGRVFRLHQKTKERRNLASSDHIVTFFCVFYLLVQF